MSKPVDQNKIWVVDFETDNLNESNRAFSASPFYKDNRIVNGCWWECFIDPESGDTTEYHEVFNNKTGKFVETDFPLGSDLHIDPPWLICGHNVRFDLHHLRSANANEGVSFNPIVDSIKEGVTTLWDTQFAEYLLSGQKTRMISLDDLGTVYGLRVGKKVGGIKELWDAGYKTREIDQDLLDDYVEQDVRMTKEIALRQIARAFEQDLLDFILVQMRSLFVVSEYEYNGMHIDQGSLKALKEAHKHQAKMEKGDTQVALASVLGEAGFSPWEEYHTSTTWFDIDSPDKLKRIVFGGTAELTYEVVDGVYKSGKKKGETKYKKQKHEVTFPAQVLPATIPEEYLTPKGKENRAKGGNSFKDVSLDDTAIDYIRDNLDLPINLDVMLGRVLSYRYHNKIVNTYCKNIEDYLFDDGKIHCSLNVDVTPTGRLTASQPNLQNIPSGEESELKKVFTSRFKDGLIGAVDFKQLEVIGLAYLTGDSNLYNDIISGVDIHQKIADIAKVAGPDARRTVKGIVFGTIYGAGVKKLAHQSGVDPTVVRKCINALKNTYPAAFGNEYMALLIEELESTAEKVGRDDTGLSLREGYLTQPTGRRITVKESGSIHIDPRAIRGVGLVEWPYTKLRNYPVQSIAKDIVDVARILFYDTIREREQESNILMINEVHDEIVFDMEASRQMEFDIIVSEVEKRLQDEINNKYNLKRDFDLPLKLEVGVGKTWKETKR